MGFYNVSARKNITNRLRDRRPELAEFRDIFFDVSKDADVAMRHLAGAMGVNGGTCQEILAGKSKLQTFQVEGLVKHFLLFSKVSEVKIIDLYIAGLRTVIAQAGLRAVVSVNEDECRRRIDEWRSR